jgi:hypothetical protein
MKKRSSLAICALIFLGLAFLPGSTLASGPRQEAPVPGTLPTGTFVMRVFYDRPEDIGRLVEFDVVEYNNVKEKYVLAAVDAEGYGRLQALGFQVQVDEKETASFTKVPVIRPDQVSGIPGYSCYRTVEETYASAQAIVAAHPTLATWATRGRRRPGWTGTT